jgi:hypothetical protein
MSAKLSTIIQAVEDEVESAKEAFPPFNSMHEGYAVIKEELDELWTEVKSQHLANARFEAVQVAAMAVRFIFDLENMRES